MSLLHPRFIIDALMSRGLSQQTIAILAGTTQATICRIHKGYVADPRWSQVYGLNALWDSVTQHDTPERVSV